MDVCEISVGKENHSRFLDGPQAMRIQELFHGHLLVIYTPSVCTGICQTELP